jgi:thiol-disulfide isomerase/thioredoxin
MSGQPIEFTPNDFESGNPQKLASKYNNSVTIVKFYSPSCGYCVSSQPEYINLATLLKEDKKYNIVQFDCSKPEHTGVLNDISNFILGYEVNGYPTHVIFVNSLFYQYYTGERNANSIHNMLTHINTLN